MTRIASMVCVALAASVARAEDAPPPPAPAAWSTLGARTAGANGNLLEGSLGWPAASVAYRRGITGSLDLGARASVTSGFEGMVRYVVPGLKFQALVRAKLLDADRVSLGLVFEPGPFAIFDRFGNGTPCFAIPFGLRLGVALTDKLNLAVSADVPLWVQFGIGGGANVPLLFGGGLEFFVLPRLALFFRVAMGPTFRPYNIVELTFDAGMGVGWRF